MSDINRTSGVELIAAERQRQIEMWGADHDGHHTDGDLVDAAVAYAWSDYAVWPWQGIDEDETREKIASPDRVRRLVKAGALIAAEIDRLTSLTSPGEAVQPS